MVATELNMHILDKILYHETLRLMYEAKEEYEKCAIQRDEVKRLELMLEE